MQWIRTHIGHFPNLCIMLSERRTQMAQNFNEKNSMLQLSANFLQVRTNIVSPLEISCSGDRHSIDMSSCTTIHRSSPHSLAAKIVFALMATAHNQWDLNSHSCIVKAKLKSQCQLQWFDFYIPLIFLPPLCLWETQ